MPTFSDWDDPPPGFAEADLVAHSGPVTRGSFVQTLVVTDIATGWTECALVLNRDQTPLREVLGEVRRHAVRPAGLRHRPVAEPEDAAVAPLEQFLAGLRTASAEGDPRPTVNPPAKPKRERRRPDPLVKVTQQLHGWFEA